MQPVLAHTAEVAVTKFSLNFSTLNATKVVSYILQSFHVDFEIARPLQVNLESAVHFFDRNVRLHLRNKLQTYVL